MHAASDGKVTVLDESGSVLYALLSPHLAPWGAISGRDVAIRRIFFDTSRIRKKKHKRRSGEEERGGNCCQAKND